MKKLLIGISAYVTILVAPTGANPATIVVEPYTVPLPAAAGLPPLVLDTTSFQQFDPALGTLNDVQLTLTGPFRWVPNQPGNTLALTLEFGTAHINTPNFPPGGGVEMANLMGMLTFPSDLLIFTGASAINGLLIFDWGAGSTPNTSPDVISQAGVMALQGTVTYDYTPAVAGVAEPSTWAMMLLGFAGLGFAFRQSRRKVSFA
jgi:PEP-CTERM motif